MMHKERSREFPLIPPKEQETLTCQGSITVFESLTLMPFHRSYSRYATLNSAQKEFFL